MQTKTVLKNIKYFWPKFRIPKGVCRTEEQFRSFLDPIWLFRWL